MAFHEVRLPARLAFGSTVSVERRTRIVGLASGFERRSTPWADGRRRYLIGASVRSLTDAAELVAFFEARRGPLSGFRLRDLLDHSSAAPGVAPTALDQMIGTGDGETETFQLTKVYGDAPDAWVRAIQKPVAGTVTVAAAGVVIPPEGFAVDQTTGLVALADAPDPGVQITAGFEFDTPVRFETDRLDITHEGFGAGRAVAVALLEVRV